MSKLVWHSVGDIFRRGVQANKEMDGGLQSNDSSESPAVSRVSKSATYVRCKEILSVDCLIKQTERDALIPSSSTKVTKCKARRCEYM